MKKVLYLSLIASSIFSMQLDLVKTHVVREKLLHCSSLNKSELIKPTSVFVPHQLGSVELYHDKKGFHVLQDDKKYEIKKYFTDPVLRDITRKQLKSFLQSGYLTINKMDNGDFSLKAKGRVKGGGVIGTIIGAFIGKAVVSVVGHGVLVAASALTGPAAPWTFVALESCFGAGIESASLSGAVAGGMLLGVATGPV